MIETTPRPPDARRILDALLIIESLDDHHAKRAGISIHAGIAQLAKLALQLPQSECELIDEYLERSGRVSFRALDCACRTYPNPTN